LAEPQLVTVRSNTLGYRPAMTNKKKQDDTETETRKDDSPLHTDTNAGPDAETDGISRQDVTGTAPARPDPPKEAKSS
jgi:hypothetical protein